MFPNLVAHRKTIRMDSSGYADVLHLLFPWKISLDILEMIGMPGLDSRPITNRYLVSKEDILQTHAQRVALGDPVSPPTSFFLAYRSLTRTTAWSSKRSRVGCSFFGGCALNRSIVFSIHVEPCIKSPGFFIFRWHGGAKRGLWVEQPNHLDLLSSMLHSDAFHQSHPAHGSPALMTFSYGSYSKKDRSSITFDAPASCDDIDNIYISVHVFLLDHVAQISTIFSMGLSQD